MANVLLCLIDGFEEIEALATVDVLRRGEVDVQTVSLTGKREVTGSHDIVVQTDVLFDDADFGAANVLIIPGGTPDFDKHEGLKEQLVEFDKAGKTIAAICAAPMVPGGLGLLDGKKATCYPGFEKYLKGAQLQDGAAVVVDGNIITGRGPGLALQFALQVLESIEGEVKRNEVAKGLLLAH